MASLVTRQPATQVARSEGRSDSTRYRLIVAATVALLIASVLVAVSVGAVSLPLSQVWRILLAQVSDGVETGASITQERIVWQFRVPRALLGVVVGAALAVVGVVLQAAVRNPLADPFIIGVTSGASLGAVLVLALGSAAVAGLSLSAAAFAGATVTLMVVYLLARHDGRTSPARLILAGVALSYLFSAATSFLIFFQSDNPYLANTVLFWLLGSLAGAEWADLTLPTAAVILGTAYLVLQGRSLNALMMGDEAASSLGVSVERFRFTLIVVSSLLVGVVVATCGAIGFIGLMVPHIVRFMIGADHRRVLLLSALVGGTLLVWVDIVSRTVLRPAELPVSIALAAIGAPFFLWLMYRRGRSSTDTSGVKRR